MPGTEREKLSAAHVIRAESCLKWTEIMLMDGKCHQERGGQGNPVGIREAIMGIFLKGGGSE